MKAPYRDGESGNLMIPRPDGRVTEVADGFQFDWSAEEAAMPHATRHDLVRVVMGVVRNPLYSTLPEEIRAAIEKHLK